MKKSPAFILTLRALAALLPLPLWAQLPVDRDGDGHSDLWQIHHGIPSANGDADSDGDGVSDTNEERAGTNPWSPDSVFTMSDFQLLRDPRGTESARFTWPALGGKRYQFELSGDLTAGPWADFGLPVLPARSGPATAEFGLATGGLRGFFRAQVSDVDADGDGLSAWEETLIGTSDLTPNSGGTAGLPDTVTAAEWAETHDPGVSAGPQQANLREVDVAFIRELAGGASGSGGADLVTATGTGAWHCLTSWRTLGGSNPAALFTTPPLQGHHARVHLLSPAKIPGIPLFVTARITPDDAFWISSRSLAINGVFQHHSTAQWKPNVLIHAKECDLAHRAFFSQPQGITHYHVVAALVQWNPISQKRNLRVLTWHVNAITGALVLIRDNFINAPEPHTDARLRIAHLAGSEYQTVYRQEDGALVHLALRVADNGTATVLPAAANTFDIRGNDNGSLSPPDAAAAGLTSAGYATATRTPSDGLRLSIWDRRTETGDLQPHLIADDTTDSAPQVPGIGQPVPVLTDSFDGVEDAGELFSQVMATGDFNGDGCDDAAFGSPQRNAGGISNSGAVFTMHGAWDGMKNEGYTQYWRQGADGLGGDNAANDTFGSALASGDFDGDGFADLAVGIPGEDLGKGAVQIIYGTAFGLSAADNFIFTEDMFAEGFNLGAANLGASLAAGDFNGDGRDDLAIGAPERAIGGRSGAGTVHVVWGSAAGLTLAGDVRLSQNLPGLIPDPQDADNGDDFGRALCAGDFNKDGRDDLAVGVPLEDLLPWSDAGAVQVFYGAANGFTAGDFITRGGFEGGSDIQGTPDSSDQFGWSIAAGDFDHDGADDLAIGVPGDSVAGDFTGALHVLYGAPGGLTEMDNQMIRQSGSLPASSSLPSAASAMEDLGWSLAAGDCNGDGFADLIASAPGEDILPDNIDGGAFFAIPGSAAGLLPASARMLRPGGGGPDGSVGLAPAPNDKFAFSLACGDFNNDGLCDVISGIPRRDKDDNNQNTGAVHFFRGSAPTMVSLATDFTWVLKRQEQVRGLVSDLSREDAGGPGAGKLYGHNEWLPAVHMASSTKTMTLLLAVEALENGDVALDDEVVISDLAGTTGGSKLATYDASGVEIKDSGEERPFIQPGDKMPLQLLIAGMMGESCNRSSVAIGEHVAEKVKGDKKEFINMMNDRAAALGMATSVMGHPAGGWVTQIQDGVTLQREGVKHSLFVKYSSFERYGDDPDEVLAGTDAEGNPKVNGPFNQFTSLGSYPGRHSWKGGNGGLWFSSNDANDVPSQPAASWCTESRVTTARRMGRTLCAVLQQTGNGTSQAQNLMDYGFRKLFTPDLRGTREFPQAGGIIGPEGPVRVRNFALTGWEGHGVTAVIDDNEELRLNIYTLDAANSQIIPAGSAVRTYFLQTGDTYEPSAQVGLSEVPSDDSLTDLFTANLIGDRLELKLWRVEQK
jgi:hypothetical protein